MQQKAASPRRQCLSGKLLLGRQENTLNELFGSSLEGNARADWLKAAAWPSARLSLGAVLSEPIASFRHGAPCQHRLNISATCGSNVPEHLLCWQQKNRHPAFLSVSFHYLCKFSMKGNSETFPKGWNYSCL